MDSKEIKRIHNEGRKILQVMLNSSYGITNKSITSILETEYSFQFDQIRKNMMTMSYYKYGPLKDNYNKYKSIDAIGSLKKRLEKYEETGNTEFLADIANFAMIEFMFPQKEGAKYEPTDSGACKIDGFGVNELNEE